MTVSNWLKRAAEKLKITGIDTARLDALVLLEGCSGLNRALLLAHPEMELSAEQVAKLEKLLIRRAQHEPLAYVRGHTEFYGRNFVITAAVLEPRPESETMIELLKQLPVFTKEVLKRVQHDDLRDRVMRLADVGAGSGALGITAKLELSRAEVDLLEIDSAALKVAQTNVDKFTLSISVLKSDLLENSGKNYDVLLCNLPYVPDDYQINQAAAREPKIAIFGGPDGLNVYRKLFDQVAELPKRPLYILTEALSLQHSTLQDIAEEHGYRLSQTDDFIQVFTPQK